MPVGLHFGKPLETIGRKVLEAVESKGKLRKPFGAMPVRLRLSKPRETVGQQSYGAYGMNRVSRFRYGSPTAGPFASEKCKERKSNVYEKNE